MEYMKTMEYMLLSAMLISLSKYGLLMLAGIGSIIKLIHHGDHEDHGVMLLHAALINWAGFQITNDSH